MYKANTQKTIEITESIALETLDIVGNISAPVFTVKAGGTLMLGKTIDICGTASTTLISVESGGKLEINDAIS